MNSHRNSHPVIIFSFLCASIAGLLLVSMNLGTNNIYVLAQKMNKNTTTASTDTSSQTSGNETSLSTPQIPSFVLQILKVQ
ncbi:MAG TPA: hypothetical protein VH500_04165 [Nitrososphaeraceae archaeon]|jgi:hypothetical protein